jgi:hypothetical protein
MKSFLLLSLLSLLTIGKVLTAQSELKEFEKDSLTENVIYGTSNTTIIATQILVEKHNTTPVQLQSALTGPGKVVTCIMTLSCLFFYFNRKK